MILRPPRSTRTDTLFPYTTLFRSWRIGERSQIVFGLQHRSGGGTDDIAAIVSLNIALDTRNSRWTPDSIGSAVAWDDAGNASLRLDTQRSRPPGVGAGYDVSVEIGREHV